MAWLIEIVRDLESGGSLYWLCFFFATVLGGIGCAALAVFVALQWREHTRH